MLLIEVFVELTRNKAIYLANTMHFGSRTPTIEIVSHIILECLLTSKFIAMDVRPQ